MSYLTVFILLLLINVYQAFECFVRVKLTSKVEYLHVIKVAKV